MLTRYLCIGLLIAVIVALLCDATAGGVIASIVLGFMAGNFACSLVHRLPRGKSILEHKPYCGVCAHPLSERDLWPVIGVLLLKHKCRYCNAPIPMSHLWTELLIGALFAVCFIQFSFSQDFILVAGIGVFLIILACIDVNEARIMPSVVVVTMMLGMLYRAVHDAEIFGFLQGGLFGLVVGLLIWRREVKPVNHIYTLPDGARLLAMAGIISGHLNFWIMLPLFGVLLVVAHFIAHLKGRARVPLTIPLGIAVMLPLLVPELALHEPAALATLP